MEVQCPAQRPRLHELAPLPERFPDVGLGDPLDARGQLQLGRAHHLGMDAADVANDLDQTIRRRALDEMARDEPTRAPR